MHLHRFAPAVALGILILLLAACSGGSPTPSIPPTAAVSPLATPVTATAQAEPSPAALDSPLAPPTPGVMATVAPPSAGKAAVAGRLIDVKSSQPMVNQPVSLPTIVCPEGVTEENKRDQCVYVVDEAFDPSAMTDADGRFVFRDVRPGEYVMLVGSPTTRSTVLADDFNQPLIWKTEADKVLELGDLAVELP